MVSPSSTKVASAGQGAVAGAVTVSRSSRRSLAALTSTRVPSESRTAPNASALDNATSAATTSQVVEACGWSHPSRPSSPSALRGATRSTTPARRRARASAPTSGPTAARDRASSRSCAPSSAELGRHGAQLDHRGAVVRARRAHRAVRPHERGEGEAQRPQRDALEREPAPHDAPPRTVGRQQRDRQVTRDEHRDGARRRHDSAQPEVLELLGVAQRALEQVAGAWRASASSPSDPPLPMSHWRQWARPRSPGGGRSGVRRSASASAGTPRARWR